MCCATCASSTSGRKGVRATAAAWRQYDRDGNGLLDCGEALNLAKELVVEAVQGVLDVA